MVLRAVTAARTRVSGTHAQTRAAVTGDHQQTTAGVRAATTTARAAATAGYAVARSSTGRATSGKDRSTTTDCAPAPTRRFRSATPTGLVSPNEGNKQADEARAGQSKDLDNVHATGRQVREQFGQPHPQPHTALAAAEQALEGDRRVAEETAR